MMLRFLVIALLLCVPGWAADYIAVHNGPQGTGDGSSVANGMSLQGAVDACTTAGDRVLMANTGTYSVTSSIVFTTAGAGTRAAPKWAIGANSSGVIDGTRAEISNSQPVFASSSYWNYSNINLTATGTFDNLLSACWNSVVTDVDIVCNTSGAALFSSNCDATIFLRCSMVNLNASRSSEGWQYSTDADQLYIDCYIENSILGFNVSTLRSSHTYVRCVAKNCTYGFYNQSNNATGLTMINCLAYDCDAGLYTNGVAAVYGSTLVDCIDGIVVVDADSANVGVVGSIIAFNSAYGIEVPGSAVQLHESYNLFYSNTSGDLSSGSISSTSVTGTDPQFTNRASDNYTVTSAYNFTDLPFTYYGQVTNMDAGAFWPVPSGGVGYRIDGGRVK